MRRIILLLGVIFIFINSNAQTTSNKNDISWETAEEILSRIKEPSFPDKDFVITDYGAVEGGQHDCTGAISKAVDDCNKSGGGRVVIPKGIYLTGAVHLKSNVNLHLVKGATLQFKTDPEAYLPVVYTRWEGIECMNYSALIYAFKQKNIAVTGEGILDGAASEENWWGWTRREEGKQPVAAADVKVLNEQSEKGIPVEQRIFGKGHFLRPNFFQPYRCENVMIEGVTVHRSPMWEINPVLSKNVIVRGLTINTHGPNNDGCDPEACNDVLIEKCLFDAGDDCIAIKAGRNDDGRRVGIPSQNLIIRNCTMKDGHAGVAIGSEIAGGCKNVFIEDCRMNSPNLERALRLKSNAKRGGIIENIFMRNITIGQVAEALLTIDFLYEEGPNGKFPSTAKNIYIENVTAKEIPRIFFINGFKAATIDNIHVSDCKLYGLKAPEVIEYAGKIVLDNVMAEPAEKVRSMSSRRRTGD
jgi:polygalacturonase